MAKASNIASLATAAILIAASLASHAQEKNVPGNINVTSHNQSGGITAYQVNIGHIYLTFSEEVAAQLTSRIPKDRPVDLSSVGSERDQQVANKYLSHLQNAGYVIRKRNIIGMMAPPPNDPIVITVHPDHTDLLIAPRA